MYTFYLQNDTSARVWRCHVSSSEHIQEHNYSTEFPLYLFPHPIAFSPGAAVAVDARILWVGPSCESNASLLAPSFSPAGSIHQQVCVNGLNICCWVTRKGNTWQWRWAVAQIKTHNDLLQSNVPNLTDPRNWPSKFTRSKSSGLVNLRRSFTAYILSLLKQDVLPRTWPTRYAPVLSLRCTN